MKVISLNTWGGEAGVSGLVDFLQAHSDVDVFCLQEVWNGGEHMLEKKSGGSWLERRVPTLLKEMSDALPTFQKIFKPHFFDFYGMAMFVKEGVEVIEEGEQYIYKEKGWVSAEEFGNHARILQFVTVRSDSGTQTIVHLHGLWNGQGKGDSSDRLEQSDRVLKFVSQLSNPHVILGDFNLRPDTQSLKKFETFGLRNLVAEYGVTSTRTSHYTKPEKFADYAFVSEGITVQTFEVLPDEVSDHSPLYLEFTTV